MKAHLIAERRKRLGSSQPSNYSIKTKKLNPLRLHKSELSDDFGDDFDDDEVYNINTVNSSSI